MSRAGSPRLAPLTREQCGDDERAALVDAYSDAGADRLLGADAAPLPSVIGTLLHHPALAGPFLTYNNVLLRQPVLDARLRELMILRVAWRTRCLYEWAQHVRIATQLAITPAEIDAVGRTGGDHRWSELETAALAATDELIDGYRVRDMTWSTLASHLGERGLVELLFVVGTYTGLAMAFNSFGLELDPELEPIAASAPAEFEE